MDPLAPLRIPKACEFCREGPPSVYCKADEAYLCANCDGEIHRINRLAARHERIPLSAIMTKAGGKTSNFLSKKNVNEVADSILIGAKGGDDSTCIRADDATGDLMRGLAEQSWRSFQDNHPNAEAHLRQPSLLPHSGGFPNLPIVSQGVPTSFFQQFPPHGGHTPSFPERMGGHLGGLPTSLGMVGYPPFQGGSGLFPQHVYSSYFGGYGDALGYSRAPQIPGEPDATGQVPPEYHNMTYARQLPVNEQARLSSVQVRPVYRRGDVLPAEQRAPPQHLRQPSGSKPPAESSGNDGSSGQDEVSRQQDQPAPSFGPDLLRRLRQNRGAGNPPLMSLPSRPDSMFESGVGVPPSLPTATPSMETAERGSSPNNDSGSTGTSGSDKEGNSNSRSSSSSIGMKKKGKKKVDKEISVAVEFALQLQRELSQAQTVGVHTWDQRRKLIQKFRAKRKARKFTNNNYFAKRKRIADTRPRVHGRFMKRSEVEAEKASGGAVQNVTA
mmetsp:Transcript_30407/g.78643  ORF Transcript_30407/g.78643 Transcript_30407/m.78643 type:complete len:499 (-) Transcript_30407:1065-2561(-)